MPLASTFYRFDLSYNYLILDREPFIYNPSNSGESYCSFVNPMITIQRFGPRKRKTKRKTSPPELPRKPAPATLKQQANNTGTVHVPAVPPSSSHLKSTIQRPEKTQATSQARAHPDCPTQTQQCRTNSSIDACVRQIQDANEAGMTQASTDTRLLRLQAKQRTLLTSYALLEARLQSGYEHLSHVLTARGYRLQPWRPHTIPTMEYETLESVVEQELWFRYHLEEFIHWRKGQLFSEMWFEALVEGSAQMKDAALDWAKEKELVVSRDLPRTLKAFVMKHGGEKVD
ncbi:hypothetical protein BJ508DRAFT_324090 [Ascobolus immersus RN42]|uniref:Uncharacterized protein n=1 Tax=Ascobolus immersus RN42 TaxID=1160509 RepID=A0A3N4IR96_ASCIM|nr:hypothetical protein BJ508DRAFT_324090 [Ascobolus immersus RN42]